MARPILFIVGLVGVVVFVLGPDMGLGLAALPIGVLVVVAAGIAWLAHERRRDASPRGVDAPRR